MASERLIVPEDHLLDVVQVIRAGLNVSRTYKTDFGPKVHKDVIEQLTKWCNEIEEYSNRE